MLGQGFPVIGCSRSPEKDAAFLPYQWNSHGASMRFHQLDLNSDLEALMTLIHRERPAYVVNFAAQSMVVESWKHPEHWFATNVVSTIRFHDRLRHCDFVKKYLHFTTPEVYGSTLAGPIDETTPFNPSTPYAVSRAAADMSLKTFHAAYGFPVVFTRAANVFGPGQELYRIIPRTILFVLLGRKLPLHGGGRSRRSFIHVRDACEATARILCDGRPGETYHIATDQLVSVREVVACVCEQMGARFEDVVEMADERLGKDTAYHLSSDKIRQELGWEDRVSLKDGIAETIEWVKTWVDRLKTLPLDYQHKP
jgi:dTDP-glucose 4,6-dehydratase